MKELLEDKLKIEKATKEDWADIVAILQETNLIDRVSGNGTHENFYTVKAEDIVSCFAIFHKDKVGILKSFGVKKECQGKGLGKIIVNKLPKLIHDIGVNTLYAASWEAPEFWEKVGFKRIKFNESKDNYFLQYAEYLEKNYPQFKDKRRYFVLEIS